MASPRSSLATPYDFSRFLSVQEQKKLSDTGGWRWISSLEGIGKPPPLTHPAHRRWIADPTHIHRPAHREIMLTLRGSIPYGFEEKVYRLRCGTVLLFDHHEARDYRVPPYSTGFTQLWIHLISPHLLTYNTFGADEQGRLYREIPPRILPASTAASLMKAWDHCRDHPCDPMANTFFRHLVTTTLLEILATATRELPPDHHREVVESIQGYIRNHLKEPLNLNRLARIAGYSPSFFHRIFHQHTGLTPQGYLDEARLNYAKELLKAHYTIEAVTEQIGMASPSYFHRFFRKRVGSPPGEWRQMQ